MPFRGLFAGVLVASVLGGDILIGDENVRKGARLRTSTTDDPMMKGLSLDDWHAMPRVALVLYIDNEHLAHGTDGEMAVSASPTTRRCYHLRQRWQSTDLIKRSITKLIPEIAGEAVRQINNQLPTSVPTTATPPVYDQDIDMDVVRLRNAALSSRQTGRVPEHQWPADIIPAVQQKLLNQIKNGEFVEFNLLLPSHAPPLTHNYLVDIVDNNAGEPSISIGRAQPRAWINNFQAWLKVWNIYLRCLIHFHSHLITQFLYYQSQITQFASIYTFPAWSLYERSFRLRVASKAIARWDFDDVELRSPTPFLPKAIPHAGLASNQGITQSIAQPSREDPISHHQGSCRPFPPAPNFWVRERKITYPRCLASTECKHPWWYAPQGHFLFVLELRARV